MREPERRRRVLPTGLTGLAGLACVACCAVPFLLAAGVLGGAGWAATGRLMPGIALVLTAAAGVAWWWAARRRHTAGCTGADCGCDDRTSAQDAEVISVRSPS
jgi:hypothetical protein